MKSHHMPAFRVLQFTDPHIGSGPLFNGIDTADTLGKVLSLATLGQAADIAIFTGDLVHHPDQMSYLRFRTLLQGLSLPIYCLPGNHDDPVLMEYYLNTDSITTEKIIRTEHWRILLLNTYKKDSTSGYLATTELDWLKHELQQARQSHILIALHHHPIKIGSNWMDDMGLKNAQALFDTISGTTVRGLLWGHIHQVFEKYHDGLYLIGSPSTCVQFKADDRHAIIHTPAYREVLLYPNGEIRSKVHFLSQ